MNREKALEIARELKKCSEEYESITVLEHDTEFFDYVIKELERTAQEGDKCEKEMLLRVLSEQIELLKNKQQVDLDNMRVLIATSIVIDKIIETIHVIKKEALLYSK